MRRTMLFNPSKALRIYRRRAFTLIELLVVLLIIGIMIGLLFPVMRKSRAVEMNVRCQSNLHQVYLATLAYTIDNTHRFPDRDTLGGWAFRVGLGEKWPANDVWAQPERFGLPALLGKQNYIRTQDEFWICPAQPHQWMVDAGNTYAFATGTGFAEHDLTYYLNHSAAWVFDNYILLPATSSIYSTGGAGYTIDADDRAMVHKLGMFSTNSKKGSNYVYTDGSVVFQNAK